MLWQVRKMNFDLNKELDMGYEKYMIYKFMCFRGSIVSISLLLLDVVCIIFDSRYLASFYDTFVTVIVNIFILIKFHKTPQFIDNFNIRFGMKLIAIVITIAMIFFMLIYFMFVDYLYSFSISFPFIITGIIPRQLVFIECRDIFHLQNKIHTNNRNNNSRNNCNRGGVASMDLANTTEQTRESFARVTILFDVIVNLDLPQQLGDNDNEEATYSQTLNNLIVSCLIHLIPFVTNEIVCNGKNLQYTI